MTTHYGTGPGVSLMAEHPHAQPCKIGMTTNLRRRLRALRTASPIALQGIHHWPLTSPAAARGFERWVFARYTQWRYRRQGEGVYVAPATLLCLVDIENRREHLRGVLRQITRRMTQLERRWQTIFPATESDGPRGGTIPSSGSGCAGGEEWNGAFVHRCRSVSSPTPAVQTR